MKLTIVIRSQAGTRRVELEEDSHGLGARLATESGPLSGTFWVEGKRSKEEREPPYLPFPLAPVGSFLKHSRRPVDRVLDSFSQVPMVEGTQGREGEFAICMLDGLTGEFG
jgi:hypothetical protein